MIEEGEGAMRARTTFVTLALVLTVAGGARVAVQPMQAQARSSSPVPIRLYVFDGGTLESDPARYQLTKEDVGVTQLSIAAHLIVHPKGLLMWDAAAVPDSEWTPTGRPVRQRLVLGDGQERFVTLTRPLTAQLLAAGHKPAEINVPGAVTLPLGSHGQRRSLPGGHLARPTGRARCDAGGETGRGEQARRTLL